MSKLTEMFESTDKYIVVTGGVISGLGKGITASSIGLLLKNRGLSVTAIKIDPYLNVDAGTMSPYEHGECYVLADGGEADLDLGNYERFLDVDLTKHHNITTGQVYHDVIKRERSGGYLGKTVQIVPHITDEIISRIEKVSKIDVGLGRPDVCIIEIGGTIGDMETAPFIEAIRQMTCQKKNKFCFVHVSMTIDNGELKTKPTQHSVASLRSYGIFPDFLIMRTPDILSPELVKKLSIFCHIPEEHIISNTNVPNIYYVPKIFQNQEIDAKIITLLDLKVSKIDSDVSKKYEKILKHFEGPKQEIELGIVGKYVGSQDTYLSLIRAVEHASFEAEAFVNVHWIDAEKVEKYDLKKYDGFIIPGGFGSRGIEGMIYVAEFTRINKVPNLGICLGLQVMVTEYLRFRGLIASSTEWNPEIEEPVIDILPDQTGIMGGTMRLGNCETYLEPKSKVARLYSKDRIVERHRHRYEVNNKYVHLLGDISVSGTSISKSEQKLVEVIEHSDHPFYIGTQYHPEYRSRYDKPHPLFVGLLRTILEQKRKKN